MGARTSTRGQRRIDVLPALLPRPKHLAQQPGVFQLSPETAIILPWTRESLDRRLLVAAEQAAGELCARTGIELKIERPRTVKIDRGCIVCRLDRRVAGSRHDGTEGDAYRLRVRPHLIEIVATSADGIRHGLQTLCQLASRRGRIRGVEIFDQPDFRDRGIMLDVSRGKVPTRETLEALVDLCCRLRLNVLMLYVEHTFEFRRHPEIGEGSSPLDAETILALDAYASDRGVELIPCLQSLGHMEHLLSIDRYARLAESDRKWSVSPSRPETYELLGELYDEFLPLFSSARFNANCDEPFDLGRGQSASRAADKSPGQLFSEHIRKLEALASEHDKRLMIWADFALKHPKELPRLGRDVVLLDWWYESSFDADRIRRLRRKGFEVWACPGTSTWNCLFPRILNSQENITRWADAGRRNGAKGLLNTDWGDFGHYNALGLSIYGYAWGAQQAWSGDMDAIGFDRAFGARIFGEKNPRMGQLHRRLGAIHDAGFRVANGSALQYLYFDPLGRSFFLKHAKRPALERSAKKLKRVLRDIERLRLEEAGDDFLGLARQEIRWSAHATQFAIEKALAALDYNDWRDRPGRLSVAARARLARRLERLADVQAQQLVELERLWLARSEISDLSKIRKRVRRSMAGLREGARRLHGNLAPRPVQPSALGLLDVYNEVRRAMDMPPRPVS